MDKEKAIYLQLVFSTPAHAKDECLYRRTCESLGLESVPRVGNSTFDDQTMLARKVIVKGNYDLVVRSSVPDELYAIKFQGRTLWTR